MRNENQTLSVMNQPQNTRVTDPLVEPEKYLLEVCWVVPGTIICQTYKVHTSSDADAARRGRAKARHNTGRTNPLEVVDLQRLQRLTLKKEGI